MKIKVIVTLKNGVLDPQGKAIQQTLNAMSFSNVEEVRQGKLFEININEGNDYSVEAIVLKAPERKDIQTKSGENIQLSEMFVEDDSGQVWIKGWRQQADLMDSYTLGDIITILGVNARPGLEGKLDLVLTPYSKIIKKN